MKIPQIFEAKKKEGKPVLSFEIFPPKKEAALQNIDETLSLLCDLHPDFISVTFGAGGSTANNKTVEIARKIKNEYGIEPIVVDPWASERDAMREYGVELTPLHEVKDADCVIVAVAHNEFKALRLDDIKKLYRVSADNEKVLIDVKGIYSVEDLKNSGMDYWRL